MDLDNAAVNTSCADPMIIATKEVRRVARKKTAPGRSATLARIIEADIIPRLLLIKGAQDTPLAPVSLYISDAEIDAFARMMIGLDVHKAHVTIVSILARGIRLETVLLQLFAPAARRLGAMWDDDDCTFADVTAGLCALQNLLRAYASGEDRSVPAPAGDGSALLAALPGEQHTFGVLMLETFFRRAGWDVVGMPLASNVEILSAAERRSFGIAGFSVSRAVQLDALRDLITAVREKSLNSKIIVLVGGRIFNETPGLFRSVGADITVCDAQQAVVASQKSLWSEISTH